jgi:predicted small integral membrane protein
MARARRHQRLSSALAFGLLALAAELLGRSLTHRVDVGRHVATPSYAHTGYYPILLAVVKGGIALLLAVLAWRLVRAHAAERAALRLVGARGRRPRLRLELSARLSLAFFGLTSVIYLVQNDAEGAAAGRWPLLSPWLHSSALPAFAVLSVLCALVWGAVRSWLADYEEYAQASVARALRLVGRSQPRSPRPSVALAIPPRRIFGLAFEIRPPPLAA